MGHGPVIGCQGPAVVVGPELEDQGEDGELELDLDPSFFDAGKEERRLQVKVLALDHYRGPQNAKRKTHRPGWQRDMEQAIRAYEAGYSAAVQIARDLGARAVADDLETALADYWRSKGVDE